MPPICCICLQLTHDDHRKRKKLSGNGCTQARATVALLSGQHILDLLMLDQHAVMCCKCESAFRNITKLEEKVVSLKTSMRDKIAVSVSRCYSNLSSQTHFYSQPNTRKRPATGIPEGAPPAKQATTQVLTRPGENLAHVGIEAHALQPSASEQPVTFEPEASKQPVTSEPEASEWPATSEPEASEQPTTPEPETLEQPATPEPEMLPSTSPTCEPQLSRHTEVKKIQCMQYNVKQLSSCYIGHHSICWWCS